MLNYLGDLCGYVYITSSNSFTYYCIFCENSFESSKEFQNHNLKEHCIDRKSYIDVKDDSVPSAHTQIIGNTSLQKNSVVKRVSEERLEISKDLQLEIETLDFDEKQNDVEELYEAKNDLLLSNDKNAESSTEKDNITEISQSDKSIQDKKELQSKNIEETGDTNVFPFGLDDLDEINLQCKYCEKQFNKKGNLIQHTKSHLNYVLTCEVCGKHSSNRIKAQVHKNTHSKVKCHLCDVILPNQKALDNHVNRHERLKCKYCSKVFKEPYAVQDHIRTHTGEKPYKCDVCSSAFALKRNLRAHKTTQHTGDIRNFACKFCDKKFKTKQLHDWHTKRVHLKEKPYQCEFCGLNWANKSELERHKLKRHTEYEKRPHHCKFCDKKFVKLKNLTEHMNTHTGEKPYECHICSKCFGQNSALREHKKLHADKKTHICKICGEAFAQHSGCANHMKQLHKITNFNNIN